MKKKKGGIITIRRTSQKFTERLPQKDIRYLAKSRDREEEIKKRPGK